MRGLAELVKSGVRQRALPKMRLQDGAIVAEDPTLDTPAAATGRVVLTRPDFDPGDLAHELRHVKQSNLLGPAALPASILEAMGKYGSGPLERDAMRASQPSHEFLRKPGAHPTAEAFLRGLLGEK